VRRYHHPTTIATPSRKTHLKGATHPTNQQTHTQNPKPQTLPTWPHGTNLREPAGHDVGQIRAGGGWRGRRIVLSDQRRCVPRHLPFHSHNSPTTPTRPSPSPSTSALKPLSNPSHNVTILGSEEAGLLLMGFALSSALRFTCCFIWLRARGGRQGIAAAPCCNP
jgi:hypothetical protein